MTECIQESFTFTAHFSRRVQSEFTAGRVSSDGGALLLREADRRINLLGRLAGCFLDGRAPLLVKHNLSEMLSQRIYGLALGYEDLCDHEQLRSDPLLGLLSGKRDLDEPLAGKSTLNRLELTGRSRRYHKISYSDEAIDRLLADLYIESHTTMPDQIVLDLDATDIPLYGHQPERFFHGYYDSYCYLPLYIFAGDQLLCARLRPANLDAAKGSVEEVSRIVAQLRQRWPAVKIVLRADSGFCREELMGWCEQNHVDYVFGLARNKRLAKIIGAQMHQAQMLHRTSGKAARVFAEFSYQTLAIGLGVAAMYFLLVASDDGGTRPLLLAIGCIGALALTHHLTSFLVVAFLVVVALVTALTGHRRAARTFAIAAAAGVAFVGVWSVIVGRRLTSYLDPILISAFDNLKSIVHGSHGRALFQGASGLKNPRWQIAVMLVAAIIWCVLLLVAAWKALFRRSMPGSRSNASRFR